VTDLRLLAYLLPIVLASLTLHELAHAWTAWRLGDPTARDQGRLTLNPIVHVDPLGTLTFVITYLVAGLPFGWARPVPVDPRNFRRPKEGMALVAAAGPATNFLLALCCLAAYRHGGFSGDVLDALEVGYTVNVVLGIFNLIPIPPLDGSRILGVVMDNATYARWVALDQVGMLVVFGLFFLFRDEFGQLLTSAFAHVTSVMDTIVRA
jgi:Zn-dependent protease